MESIAIKNPLDLLYRPTFARFGGGGNPKNNKALIFIIIGGLAVTCIGARRGRSVF